MKTLDIVRLTELMERTRGAPRVTVGLVDGPVAVDHPLLTGDSVRAISRKSDSACTIANSMACMHGTLVAGILSARRGSPAPAICPDCTLLVRPIFAETQTTNGLMPSATPQEFAAAILECVASGARVVNLSLALAQPSLRTERELEQALDHAASKGVIVVAAAGNQGVVGSSAITRHPWVIPVIGYNLHGRPTDESNLGNAIGRRGLGAPGDNVVSLGTKGDTTTFGGTSAAAPFVTGAIALLWSEFPTATATEVKLAITQAYARRRTTVIPPLLDAWGAYQFMKTNSGGR